MENMRIKLSHAIKNIDERRGTIDFDLTTLSVDLDGEVVKPDGMILTPNKSSYPFLWVHQMSVPPLGHVIKETLQTTEQNASGTVDFDMDDKFAAAIFRKYSRQDINDVSIGFMPTKIGEKILDGQTGPTFEQWRLLELSATPIGSNMGAQQKSLFEDMECDSKCYFDMVKNFYEDKNYEHDPHGWAKWLEIRKNENDPEIKTVSKEFNPSLERIEAHKLEYEWASRFCSCEVKDLYVLQTSFGDLWKGSFLSAYMDLVREWKTVDVRNLHTDGTEMPPSYDVIRANSRETFSFMTEGMTFFRSPDANIIVKFWEIWGGMGMRVYVDRKDAESAEKIIGESWENAALNHKLKGEAFTLTVKFLQRKGEDWSKVILPEKNKSVLLRTEKIINEKGFSAPNRGLIFMGQPGTGKTLSGRVLMNTAKSTFIWVSTKDFWSMGGMSGLLKAFSLAKVLAPSIVFIEDIDNWMHNRMVDLLKTEMDGIEKSNGVTTILTTNYPERLSDALLDRPGRFDDVLHFNLPGENERKTMLIKWANVSETTDLLELVEKLEGYSGAHIFELVEYAKSIAEEKKLPMTKSLDLALEKIIEQRELINEVQLAGSNYKPKLQSASNDGLKVKLLPGVSAIEIEGRQYSYDLFKAWGIDGMPVNTLFKLIDKEKLTIEKIIEIPTGLEVLETPIENSNSVLVEAPEVLVEDTNHLGDDDIVAISKLVVENLKQKGGLQ